MSLQHGLPSGLPSTSYTTTLCPYYLAHNPLFSIFDSNCSLASPISSSRIKEAFFCFCHSIQPQELPFPQLTCPLLLVVSYTLPVAVLDLHNRRYDHHLAQPVNKLPTSLRYSHSRDSRPCTASDPSLGRHLHRHLFVSLPFACQCDWLSPHTRAVAGGRVCLTASLRLVPPNAALTSLGSRRP